mgnify:FL=1|tara:strand:- start:143 stop:385 length:243 start_codon:yes stop_codon:yes gene_type:complete
MIKIYGTKTCSYCTRAKDLCSVNNIPFIEINISENEEAKQMLLENNYKTVPQIWDDEHYVGGYTDLVQYVSKQKGTASLV